jgi:hypothetical protein
MDRKTRWFHWYPTRADILRILFAIVVVFLFAFVVVRFPYFRQVTGFGPDWDCEIMARGDPVCIKKPSP